MSHWAPMPRAAWAVGSGDLDGLRVVGGVPFEGLAAPVHPGRDIPGHGDAVELARGAVAVVAAGTVAVVVMR